jgi:hypothetical protein
MFKIKTSELGDSIIYSSGDNSWIPLDPANADYQRVLDAINTDGADAWDDTVATYDDIPEDLRTAAEGKKFNQQLADYKVAKARLEQYEVATGRAEETETVVVGQEWDEDAQDFVDVTETYVSKRAIDPVDATVEQTTYDDNGENPVTTNIENPLITTDKAERAAAQAVVDATPQAVKDAV